ncbi:MAG: hypothetical protein GY822_07340 [Deltaproteobacteria bacterium]|nr:hypothetical protein [Deltaproteobacteria bacterium]
MSYKRSTGNNTTTIQGPLKEFIGDDFEVGIWMFSAQFQVSQAPIEKDGKWQMVVDDVPLTKVD